MIWLIMIFLYERIDGVIGQQLIAHASSSMEGATAINRSHLVGGHAGGMDGIESGN